MKKTNKPNPLKTFNDNKAAAYKKASGAMKTFKKSLPKAQDGIQVQAGPLPERATKGLDYNFSIPSAPEVMAVRDQKEMNMRQSPEFQTEKNMRADYYRKGGSVKSKKK